MAWPRYRRDRVSISGAQLPLDWSVYRSADDDDFCRSFVGFGLQLQSSIHLYGRLRIDVYRFLHGELSAG